MAKGLSGQPRGCPSQWPASNRGGPHAISTRVVSAQVPRTQYHPMPIWAHGIVGPLEERWLRGGEPPVGPSAHDHLRLGPQPGDDSSTVLGSTSPPDRCRSDASCHTSRYQEHVLADVDVARRVCRSSPGTLVTVAAAVSGATVDPVRIHPPTAHPALHQPGEHVIARRSVRTLPGRTTLLYRDELSFTDQRRMRVVRDTAHSSATVDLPAPGWRRCRLHTSRPVYRGLVKITATDRRFHPCPPRCRFRSGLAADGHGTPRRFNSRAIPATLRRFRSAAASGRRPRDTRRKQPTSKNSVVITPRPATSVAAISRCHACDVTGSWNSAVDVRP